jgi:3-phosphoglycerate kinase
MRLDICLNSVVAFSSALQTTQTIIWNGPMGVFEFDKVHRGNCSIKLFPLLRKLRENKLDLEDS